MAGTTRPRHSAIRTRNRLIGVAIAACTALSLTGCTSDSSKNADAKDSPTPSASASTTPADPTEAAKKAAITTYHAYWQEMEKLYADITGEAGDIDRYAASTALSSARSDAKSVHDRHLVHTGDVSVLNTTATAADLQRKIPNVQLTSCLDISRWKVMNTKTGKPAALPSGRLTKFVAVSTVERWPKGWRVIRNEPQGKPC